jgi:hypothetical protein
LNGLVINLISSSKGYFIATEAQEIERRSNCGNSQNLQKLKGMEQPHNYAIKVLNKQIKEQVKAVEHVKRLMVPGRERKETLDEIEEKIKRLNAAIVQLVVL